MLTQTDIATIIRSSPHANADMKRDLLQLLPQLYERISHSLLLDPVVGEDFLVMLPLMSKEQIARCWQTLSGEDALVQKMIEELVTTGGEEVVAQWDALEHGGTKLLKGAAETMDRAQDESDMEHLEQQFSENP